MKSLRKTKRVSVWCTKIPIPKDFIGTYIPGKKLKWPKYIRCPKCNRRLKTKITNCHAWIPVADVCLHSSIPAHKTLSKNKHKNKK